MGKETKDFNGEMEGHAGSSNHFTRSSKREVDLLFGADGDMIDGDSFQALKEAGQYGVTVSPPVGSRSIVINSNQPITQDPKVREAFQYAIQKR